MQLAVLGFEGMRGHDFHRALIRIHETVTEVSLQNIGLFCRSKNIGLFCKRDLQKRPIFCKERALIRIHETVTEVVQKDLDLNAYGGRGMGWLR